MKLRSNTYKRKLQLECWLVHKTFGIQHVGIMKHFPPLTSVSYLAGFLPALLKVNSLSPPGILLLHPYMLAFLRILSVTLFFTLHMFSPVPLVALKPLSGACSQTFIFNSLFTATWIYVHVHKDYLGRASPKQPVPEVHSSPHHHCLQAVAHSNQPQSYLHISLEPIFNFQKCVINVTYSHI